MYAAVSIPTLTDNPFRKPPSLPIFPPAPSKAPPNPSRAKDAVDPAAIPSETILVYLAKPSVASAVAPPSIVIPACNANIPPSKSLFPSFTLLSERSLSDAAAFTFFLV